MIKKKLTSVALTGALALGGLGIGSMADLPSVPGMGSQQAEASGYNSVLEVIAASSSVTYKTKDAISTTNTLETTPDGAFGDSNPRWIIKNSTGTVVKSGAMNGVDWELYGTTFTAKETNISLAGLPKNTSHYRIEFTWTAFDGTVTSAQWPGLTKAFTYNADGSITNIRN
ncbi:hypothetical protein [Paenisporosarcina sp. OV554]|uniref:hypothetical protein n=1 Tax=Paenisporosarcina sp. OV554 TaxID=2135694 RepID=UPI000D392132|nr:hypothetical protein [Paenisporosarcina sp. OV554]PUB12641.1 hypothetical protein C8K15_109140 [Paenisporosarcina sp. OV554]